jgi:hypothetical protein
MALFTPSFFRHLRNENRNENSGDLWFQEEARGRDKLGLGLATQRSPRPSDDASKANGLGVGVGDENEQEPHSSGRSQSAEGGGNRPKLAPGERESRGRVNGRATDDEECELDSRSDPARRNLQDE